MSEQQTPTNTNKNTNNKKFNYLQTNTNIMNLPFIKKACLSF